MISTWRILNVYDKCQWTGGLDAVRIVVEVIPGRVHWAHRLRIREYRRKIGLWLLSLRSDLMRSSAGKLGIGKPWQMARYFEDGCKLENMEVVERLIALGVAADFITISHQHVPGISAPQTFIVIEDIRIQNFVRRK